MTHIQPLESRQLLSATLHPIKVVPKIPHIVGTYRGTNTRQTPSARPAESLTVTISTETAAGKFTGSLKTGENATVTGSINAQNQFTAQFTLSFGKGSLTGVYNPTTHAFSGHFLTPAEHGGSKANGGIFSVKLVG